MLAGNDERSRCQASFRGGIQRDEAVFAPRRGDKPDEKRREGSGAGSNGDRHNEQDSNGLAGMTAEQRREVRDLLDKLEKLGVSPKDRDYLEKEMAKAGFGLDVDRTKRTVNWGLVNGDYAYPAAYNSGLLHLQEDIQERIQTLILGDLGNVTDDAAPAGKTERQQPKGIK